MQTEKRRFITVLLVVLAVGCLASEGQSQIVYGKKASGSVGVIYSSWSLDSSSYSTTVSQSSLPISTFLPLKDNLEAHLSVSASSSNFDDGTDDLSLSGLGDLRLQVSQSYRGDQLLLSFGLNLPTGKTSLDQTEELPVLQMLTQNFLNFPMRRFGNGFGFNVLFGGAQMFGEWRLGGCVMYQFIGEYDPYKNFTNYDPGDLITLDAGADRRFGPTVVSTNAALSFYGKDTQDSEETFKQSSSLRLRLNVSHQPAKVRFGGGVRYIARGRNTKYVPPTEERLKIYGNEFAMSADVTKFAKDLWSYGPRLDVRLVGANDQGFGSSTIISGGGSVSRQIGDQGQFELGLIYFTGSADGGDLDVSGLQISAGVRINR